MRKFLAWLQIKNWIKPAPPVLIFGLFSALPRSRIDETVTLIKKMAGENQLGCAERKCGELLKLGIKVSKQTIQKYLPKERRSGASSQTWATFLKSQAGDIRACEFSVVSDWFFRQW